MMIAMLDVRCHIELEKGVSRPLLKIKSEMNADVLLFRDLSVTIL